MSCFCHDAGKARSVAAPGPGVAGQEAMCTGVWGSTGWTLSAAGVGGVLGTFGRKGIGFTAFVLGPYGDPWEEWAGDRRCSGDWSTLPPFLPYLLPEALDEEEDLFLELPELWEDEEPLELRFPVPEPLACEGRT